MLSEFSIFIFLVIFLIIGHNITTATIITIIDIICFYQLPFMNILNIFDNNILNFILTIVLTLLVLFIMSYLLDYVITEVMLKKYFKKTNRKQGD